MPTSLPPDMPLASNEDLDLCRRCGGECCLTRPGVELPARFLAAPDPAALLATLLAHGWVLDRHLGLPVTPETSRLPDRLGVVTWYPRPATRTEREEERHFALPQPGPCSYLTENGCRLPFTERPAFCQALAPDPAGDCRAPWGRPQAALAWHPCQQLVRDALAHLGLELPAA